MRTPYYKTFLQDVLLVLLCLVFFLLASWGIDESSSQWERTFIFIVACYICFMTVISFISTDNVHTQTKEISEQL